MSNLKLWEVDHHNSISYVAAHERGDVLTWSINDWVCVFLSSDEWIGPTDDGEWNEAFQLAMKCVQESTVKKLSVGDMRKIRVLDDEEQNILDAKILLEDYVKEGGEIPGLVFDNNMTRIVDNELESEEYYRVRNSFSRDIKKAIDRLFSNKGFLSSSKTRDIGRHIMRMEYNILRCRKESK